jgi:hypothetical protein
MRRAFETERAMFIGSAFRFCRMKSLVRSGTKEDSAHGAPLTPDRNSIGPPQMRLAVSYAGKMGQHADADGLVGGQIGRAGEGTLDKTQHGARLG